MKKTITFLQQHLAVATIIFVLAFAQQSCKKTNADVSPAPHSSQSEIFLTLPSNADPELAPVISDLKNQPAGNNFVGDFISAHGQPLWAHAIKSKKDTGHIVFYIPTQEPVNNTIAAFFIAKYSNGQWYYELHRRSMLNSSIKEPTAFKYQKADYAKILGYFTYKILNKKDTLLQMYPDKSVPMPANNKNQVNDNAAKLISLCFSYLEQVPCFNGNKADVAAKENIYIPKCYVDIFCCMTVDDGSGGSGTGDGDNGGGGNTPAPNPNPCLNKGNWYKLIPEPCDEVPENGCKITPEQGQIILDNMIGEDQYVTHMATGGPQVNQNGIIKEPKIYDWMFFSLNMMPGHKPEWSAYFTGIRFKANQNAAWKWESFNYVSTAQSGGVMAPCMSADMSTIVSTLISADKLKVIATLHYNCKVKIPCLFGMELNDTYNKILNDDIFAWE